MRSNNISYSSSNSMYGAENASNRSFADNQTDNQKLTRKTLKKNTIWRYVMRLPQIPETSFEVRPDQELSSDIVDQQYNRIWSPQEINALEVNLTKDDEEAILRGVPSMAMAEVVTKSMRWPKLVQSGVCSPTYANDKFMLQLTNTTIVAILMAGFGIAATLGAPDFVGDTLYPKPLPEIFQCAYSIFMITSTLYCFSATGIALHSINRISNVCPSKTAVAYMTAYLFFDARDAVNDYVYKGMAFGCGGIVTGFIWLNQNIFYGIPAALLSALGTLWFLAVYNKWDKMATFHSDVGDKLCAKDIVIAAEKGQSISEAIWTV